MDDRIRAVTAYPATGSMLGNWQRAVPMIKPSFRGLICRRSMAFDSVQVSKRLRFSRHSRGSPFSRISRKLLGVPALGQDFECHGSHLSGRPMRRNILILMEFWQETDGDSPSGLLPQILN